jgi:hypothetical protein
MDCNVIFQDVLKNKESIQYLSSATDSIQREKNLREYLYGSNLGCEKMNPLG